MPSKVQILTSALLGATVVSAHGYVTGLNVNGVWYDGYDITKWPYTSEVPNVVGWSTSAKDSGYVAPDEFNNPDIICHKDGGNALGYATVAAGDSIYLQWDKWPADSHKGPVMDYLAACGDQGCSKVDKTTLEFFKISEKGLIDGSGSPGTYATDQLAANGIGWLVQIPKDIAPGSYVLRHEIIALHGAETEDGAQNYPQCFNLQITGSGTDKPAGVLGTSLYTPQENGILFNIYTPLSSYPIPGPAIIPGAVEVDQSSSAITATGTATTGVPAAPTAAPTQPTQQPNPGQTTQPAPGNPAPTPQPTPEPNPNPEQPEPVPNCPSGRKRSYKKRKTQKIRRHVRDVKNRNVAPIHN